MIWGTEMSKTNRISHRHRHNRTRTPNSTTDLEIVSTDKKGLDCLQEQYLIDMWVLKQYVRSIGYSFVSRGYFAVNFWYKRVYVEESASPERWIRSVLHELGHVKLETMRERNQIKTSLRRINIELRLYKPTEVYYRSYFRMEWKAWEQGHMIATRLGLRLNEEGYWGYAKECYQTYLDNLRTNTTYNMRHLTIEAKKKKEMKKKLGRRRVELEEWKYKYDK